MRKLMLWGAAVAIAFGATAGVANVVVVKSLGPSAKAYPPGKMLPESAKISLQGGDVVTLLGPGSAQTLRGPGNFPAQVAMNSAAASRGRLSSPHGQPANWARLYAPDSAVSIAAPANAKNMPSSAT